MAIQLWKDGRVNVTSTKTSYDTYTITHVTKYVIGDDVSQFGAVAEFLAKDDSREFVERESAGMGTVKGNILEAGVFCSLPFAVFAAHQISENRKKQRFTGGQVGRIRKKFTGFSL